MLVATACDTSKPAGSLQPAELLSNQTPPSPSTPVPLDTDPAQVGEFSTAILYQAKNGPGSSPGTVTWVNGNVSAIDSHYLEGYSIPYRIVMNSLPTDGTIIELVIGYDVKHSGKHAVSYLTHYQRLEPHVNTFGHPAEEIDPLAGVSGVPITATTMAIPEPRVSKLIDCRPGDLQQPSASFIVLNSDEKEMSLYGGTLVNLAYDGIAPDLDQANAEERIRVRFTASSSTAVLTWGGYIATRGEFGCPGNRQSAGGSFGSPYIAKLKSWNLNTLAPQTVALSATTVVEPALFCEVTGPRPVCPNSTDNVYSTTITGYCKGPAFTIWNVVGDGEIVGSDEESTVNVTAGASGVFLVYATTFCLDCENCEPILCCGVVYITPPPEAIAGPDATVCPATSGPTCFPLAGSGTDGAPSWSVQTQPAGCTVTMTNGDTFTPLICFPQGCVGTATLRLTMLGECANDIDDVTLSVSPASTADAGPDDAKCPVSSAATCFNLTGSGSNGIPSWSVVNEPSPGSVTIQNGNTFTPTACVGAGITGSATLRLTVVGEPPCPASDEVVLTVGVPTSANAGPDASLCESLSGPTCFQLTGSGVGDTHSWSVVTQPLGGSGCNVVITGGNTLTPTVCFPAGCAGTATLRLTVQGDTNCPESIDDVVLTVAAPPTTNAGPDESMCPAPTGPTCFTLSGSGSNGTPSWIVVNQPSPGSVTIQNGSTFAPTICFGEGIDGSATLRLTVTGDSLCPPSTDEIVLSVALAASADAGSDASLCVATSGPTCFQLTGSGVGGTPFWSVATQTSGGAGCNVVISNGNTFSPTVCFPAGCTGLATIQLTVSGAQNCPPASANVSLTVVSAPTSGAGPDATKCPNPDGPTCFSLSGSGSGSPSWSVQTQPSPGSVTIQNGNTFTPEVCFGAGVLGSATLRLTVTGSALCSPATDNVVLSVGPSDLACQMDTATSAGIFTGNISGGTAPYTCEGSFSSSGWTLTDCQVNGAFFQVSYVRDGGICTPTPTVTVTITDSEGCITECTQEIPCPQGCVAQSIIACECPDNPVWICAAPSGGLPPFTFSWVGPDNFTDNTQCIMVNKPGIYTSTITDGNGLSETCCSAVVDTHLHGPSPCPGETGLTYEAHFDFPGGTFTPTSYSWEIFGNGAFCGPTDEATICVDAGNSGVFTLLTTVTGTMTFTCEGATESIPISGSCALAYIVEDQNCH
jgi:hypothetical protein